MFRLGLLWVALLACLNATDVVKDPTQITYSSEKSSNPFADASFHHDSSLSQALLPDAISSGTPESIPSENSRTESYSSYVARLSSMAESSSGPSLSGWAMPWQTTFNPSVADANTISNTAVTTNAVLGALGAALFGTHWYRRHELIQLITGSDGCGKPIHRAEGKTIEQLQKIYDECKSPTKALSGSGASLVPAHLSQDLIQSCGVEVPFIELRQSTKHDITSTITSVYQDFMSGQGAVGWFDVRGSSYDTLCPLIGSHEYTGDLGRMGTGVDIDRPLSSSFASLSMMAGYCLALLDRPVASRVALGVDEICSKNMMISRLAFYGPHSTLGKFCDSESGTTLTKGCLQRDIQNVFKELHEIPPVFTTETPEILRGGLLHLKLQQVLHNNCPKLKRPYKKPKWDSDYTQDSLKVIYTTLFLDDDPTSQEIAMDHFCGNTKVPTLRAELEAVLVTCSAARDPPEDEDSEALKLGASEEIEEVEDAERIRDDSTSSTTQPQGVQGISEVLSSQAVEKQSSRKYVSYDEALGD